MHLTELLIVLALVAILSNFALPGMQELVEGREHEADYDAFAALLISARQSAILLNAPVTFCPGAQDRCGRRDLWQQQTLAFVDENRNRIIDGNDHIIGQLKDLSFNIRWRSFRNRSYLRFRASGFTHWQNGNFTLCTDDADPTKARQLVLNQVGRIYFSRDEDDDGVHEDVQGNPLTC